MDFYTIIEPSSSSNSHTSRQSSNTRSTGGKGEELSPGERIQLYLGYSGSCYHIILNHDDGITRWQTQASSGCIPPGIIKQFQNMRNKNRFVTHVTVSQVNHHHDQDENYFVRGSHGDGTNDYYWSDVPVVGSGDGRSLSSSSSSLFETNNKIPRLVAFGRETTVIIYENGKFNMVGHYIRKLANRLRFVRREGGTVHCLRLYRHHKDCYFIRDSFGCEWDYFNRIPKYLKLLDELDKDKKSQDDLVDVIISIDSPWIVLRKTRYVTSDHIGEKITNLLDEFYWSQNQYYQQGYVNYMNEYKTKWEQPNKTILKQRRLREGIRVTIVEKSSRFGDAIIVTTQPAIWIKFNHSSNANLIRIDDAATILPYDDNITTTNTTTTSNTNNITNTTANSSSHDTFDDNDDEQITSESETEDEFDNATHSVYRCLCNESTGWTSVREQNDGVVIIPMHRRLIVPGSDYYCVVITSDPNTVLTSKTSNKIDPNKCVEKIDVSRLRKLNDNLQTDTIARDNLFNKMTRFGKKYAEQRKVLERCKGIELLVSTLMEMVRGEITDTKGCYSYDVKYETKDPLYPGRLFAIGKIVPKTNHSTTVRTATVQGMYRELRAPLVGIFGHDIDCANSDVRILCSLAQQLNVERLIPTLLEYRDDRNFSLKIIQKDHNKQQRNVTIDEAKRLPTMIITGGDYFTWLRATKIKYPRTKGQGDSMTEQFVFNLQTEIRALELLLMHEHKRFPWMAQVRKHFEESVTDGKKSSNNRSSQMDRYVLQRIIYACENIILSLMHQHISDLGWIVRTKIFDGLIIEPSSSSKLSLKDCLQRTEQYCKLQGWDIQLVEKPLYGQQDQPIPSLVKARNYLKEFQHL